MRAMPSKSEPMNNQQIAEDNTILRCVVGSTVHGLAVTDGLEDRDEMGVCIEPPECVIGLRRFDHWVYRTKPDGVRSEAGDLDLVIYSLRKWMRLALRGNPTVLLLLFAPDDAIIVKPIWERACGASLPAWRAENMGRRSSAISRRNA